MALSEQHARPDSHDRVDTPARTHYKKDSSHEKDALLGSSYEGYGSNGAVENAEGIPVGITTYRSRFWILAAVFFLCVSHDVQWIIWGPISESMNYAFSGWGPSTVALMINWGTISFVLFVIPVTWAVQRYGIRASIVTSSTILTAGTCLRCITSSTPTFTILCHVCSIAVGLVSPIMLATPTLIASDWFPVQERSTALAVMLVAHQLGGVISYLEPLLVRQPGPDVTPADIQHDVMHLLYIVAGMAAVLLVGVIVYFPSKPPSPPSVSSSEKRIRFLPGLKALFRNKKFMWLLVSYAVFIGPSIIWLTVLNYSLLPLGFHQNKSMWVGLTAVIVSSLLPVMAARLNDLRQGYTKPLLIILMVATTFCFYWFLLLSYDVLPVTDWQVYVSVVGSLACNYSALPLFLELAIDLTYPVPEILTTGIMIAADNLVGVIFLLLFNIPDEEHLWVTYTLTLCSSVTIVPLVAVTFPSTRTAIDMG